MFLLEYEECCEVHQDRRQNLIRPFQTLIQLWYYTKAGGERKHANVKVVEQRVALLLCREQTLDKERDIKDTESGTCVFNSGPAQAQSRNE